LYLEVARIRMYTTAWCGYCVRAKALLDARGVDYDEVDLGDDPRFRARLNELTGGWTVPQIVVGGRSIGGYTELRRLEREGRLDRLLAA
jgi:glutaredoxin 3